VIGRDWSTRLFVEISITEFERADAARSLSFQRPSIGLRTRLLPGFIRETGEERPAILTSSHPLKSLRLDRVSFDVSLRGERHPAKGGNIRGPQPFHSTSALVDVLPDLAPPGAGLLFAAYVDIDAAPISNDGNVLETRETLTSSQSRQ
jgi:hypothetical protein